MKKLILLQFVLVLLYSCNSYKNFINQEKKYVYNEIDSIYNGRHINLSINNTSLKLLFDTGASKSVLYDINQIGGESILNNKNSSKIIAKGAINKIEVIKYTSDSISSKIFKSKLQQLLIVNNQNQVTCNQKLNYDGILGIDSFEYSDKPLFLNYQNNTFSFVESFNSNDFTEINSKFSRSKIYLEMKVNNESNYFLLDTGADAFILLEKDFKDRLPNSSTETLIGTFNANMDIKKSTINYYKIENTKIGNYEFSNVLGSKIPNVNKNILGINFIKNFNWVIDFVNKKIYIKQNNPFDDLKLLNEKQIKVIAINQKLIIGLKNKNITNYNIGDQIVSVNDQLITAENICDIQDYLNKTEDWSTIKIKIKK